MNNRQFARRATLLLVGLLLATSQTSHATEEIWGRLGHQPRTHRRAGS